MVGCFISTDLVRIFSLKLKCYKVKWSIILGKQDCSRESSLAYKAYQDKVISEKPVVYISVNCQVIRKGVITNYYLYLDSQICHGLGKNSQPLSYKSATINWEIQTIEMSVFQGKSL
jgi:hypothetical protein